jgi:hypothetical protein
LALALFFDVVKPGCRSGPHECLAKESE